MDEVRDPLIQAAFANADQALDPAQFKVDVMARVDAAHRSRLIRRIIFSAVCFVVAIPLQDIGLWLAHALMTTLVELENQFASDLLAPL